MSSLITTLSTICLIVCVICLFALKSSSNVPGSVQAIAYLFGIVVPVVTILYIKKEE